MEMSLSNQELKRYIKDQITYLFPDKYKFEGKSVDRAFRTTLERVEYCFSFVSIRGYHKEGKPFFNHLFADQYLLFVWYFSNTLWDFSHDEALCGKLFALNRALNSFSCSYDTDMPDVFLVFHACGTVLGKASYANFFTCAHQCTVGHSDGIYPVFDQGAALTAGSSVIGNCKIGLGSCINTNTNVYKKDIPSRHIAFTNAFGMVESKEYATPYTQSFFNIPVGKILMRRFY